jgi:cytochrome c oxidase accessory protein FixG
MVVAYDYQRGEPRHKFVKAKLANTGDCIDCHQCVKVCPTGIDIRNGTQMECIGCTACIDACNAIMIKTDRPRGLIRYASENGLKEGASLRYTPRMKLYTALLLALSVFLAILLVSRKEVSATIMRTPGMLYQERGADSISNLYNIKVVNKTSRRIPLVLKVEDATGNLQVIGHVDVDVKAEGQGSGIFFITRKRNEIIKRKSVVRIGLYEGDHRIDIIQTNFLAPTP